MKNRYYKDKIMKKIIFLLFISVFALSSCIQSEQEVVLNPDGSGKLMMKNSIPINIMGSSEKEDLLEKAKQETANMLVEAEGIRAWKDVRYEISSDSSSMTVWATGYFDDINALGNKAILFPIKMSKSGSGLQINMLNEKFDNNEEKNGSDKVGNSTEIAMTEEEIQQKMQEYKASSKQLMGFLMMMFAEFRITVKYLLPGKVKKFETFKNPSPNTIAFSFDGETIIKLANDELDNEKFIRDAVLKGKSALDFASAQSAGDSKEYMKKIFGGNELPSAFISAPLKDQFDYKTELAQAEVEWEKIKKQYDVDKVLQEKKSKPNPEE